MAFNLLRSLSPRPFFSSGSRNFFSAAVKKPSSAHRLRPFLLGTTCLLAGLTLYPRTTLHLDSDASPPEVAESVDTTTDPATSIAFPNSLHVPAKIQLPKLSLLGVGVRTVSFLGIKVYSVGFYADLANPELKIPKDLSPEEKLGYIVRNTACVIRIIPTRNTNYTHLRDAFMRSLQARMATGRRDGTISEEVELSASSPMRKLKSLFPNSALSKHTPLDIFLAAPTPGRPRALVFRDMGAIENDWVATELVLHYFTGDGPSPPLKNSVLERVSSL